MSIEGTNFNIIKAIHDKLTANIYSCRRLKTFPPISGTLLFNVLKCLARATGNMKK